MPFWRKKDKRKEELRIVLGAGDPAVFAALEGLEVEHQVVAEVLTCDGLYRALAEGADLVIADLRRLAPLTLSAEGLAEILSRCNVPLATPQEFVADPGRWQEAALAARGFVEHLPARCAVVTGYAGGVGKTTIALDTAVLFARRSGLPALVAEFGHGVSALRALCDQGLPDMYDCITDGKTPGTWRGVTLLPMNYELTRMLTPDQLQAFLEAQRKRHVLTLCDVRWPHDLWPGPMAPDLWLVVGTPKPDALHNAVLLAGEVTSQVRVIINMVRGRVGLVGYERDLDLPFIASPERYDGRLGERVLPLIYAHWR